MKPYIPEKLPIEKLDYKELLPFITSAVKELSTYNGILKTSFFAPELLIAPNTTKEATLSSKIEGTQISFIEMLEIESNKGNNYEKNDVIEIQNYKKALLRAEELFKILPHIHLNMIRELHYILLDSVRGENKAKGEFRKIQVYIGASNSSIENATYIPPEAQHIMPALDNWEKYINNDEQESLLQCAIMHAQFEIIHPFLDGNGRIGRMLIPLFLYQKEYIDKPIFYLSEYFEKHRNEYYTNLNNITKEQNWNAWIVFFLNAIKEQANKNIKTTMEIISLYNELKMQFISITESKYAINILDNLFKKPFISSTELAQKSNISNKATYLKVFDRLVKNGLITTFKEAKGNLPIIYKFDKLIEVIDR